MAITLTGHSISALSKNYGRHEDVRRTSIMVAAVISEIVKTMLGPKGMDKMLVTTTGDVVITNDGKVALDRLNVTHPIAKILIEVAKTQDAMTGDGTKTAVILVGELLKEAEKLLDQKIHPATIIKGYSEAARKTLEILDDIAVSVQIRDEQTLKKIAKTVMGGRITGDLHNRLAELVVSAVKRVAEEKMGKIIVDVDRVDFRAKAGGSINDLELLEGLVIYKGKPRPEMPSIVKNSKISLLRCSLSPLMRKTTDWSKEYVIKDPKQMGSFLDKEREFSNGIVDKFRQIGSNVVLCRKRISESVLNCFADEGVLALDLVGDADMVRLEKATGAKIMSSLDDLAEKDLGEAGLVEFRKIAGDEMLFIDSCRDPKASTVLVRGGAEHVVDELQRIVKDSVKVVAVAVENGKAVAGGGATEMEVSKKLGEFSKTFKGKEQLVVEAFAEAVEAIPKILAMNAGLDPIKVLAELRAGHAAGNANLGINCTERKVEDVMKRGLVDTFRVKQHAIKAASEVATIILRIDDIIAAAAQLEIREEEKSKEKERKRIMEEKVRRFLKKEEELKEVDRRLMERIMHPETV